jgi:hypothetical protein
MKKSIIMVMLFIIWLTKDITAINKRNKHNQHNQHNNHDNTITGNSKKIVSLSIDELLAILGVRILLNKHGMKKQLRNQEKYLDKRVKENADFKNILSKIP